jgi:carbon monoxide dehydrogenase subunit G
MAELTVRALLPAPPDVVWRVIERLDRQGEWMADVRSLEITSPRRKGVGALLDVRSELFGLPVVHDVMEVTAWEPPHLMEVRHRGAFHGIGEFRLEPVGDATLFTWLERFTPPLGPLGEAVFALVVRPHLRRVFRRSLRNLARFVEIEARRR